MILFFGFLLAFLANEKKVKSSIHERAFILQ